jgi:hypothetical protein
MTGSFNRCAVPCRARKWAFKIEGRRGHPHAACRKAAGPGGTSDIPRQTRFRGAVVGLKVLKLSRSMHGPKRWQILNESIRLDAIY